MSQFSSPFTRVIDGVLAGLMLGVVLQPAFAQDTIPAGTPIAVRVAEKIDSRGADLQREYSAELDEPLVVNGVTLAPKSAPAVLRVAQVEQAGAVKGRANLTLRLEAIVVNGQRIALGTETVTTSSGSQAAKATKGGVGGAALGAAIGGILGGGSGAATGAALGGSLGVGAAALSGQRVQVAKETRLTFTVAATSAVAAAAPAAIAPAQTAAPATERRPITTATANQIRFEFVDAVADGKTLDITMSVLNLGVDRRFHNNAGRTTECTPAQVVDDSGNNYTAAALMLGNQSPDRSPDLVNGVQTKLTLHFEGLQTIGGVPTINEIKRLTIGFIAETDRLPCAKAARIELRDLPVQKR